MRSTGSHERVVGARELARLNEPQAEAPHRVLVLEQLCVSKPTVRHLALGSAVTRAVEDDLTRQRTPIGSGLASDSIVVSRGRWCLGVHAPAVDGASVVRRQGAETAMSR